MGLPVEEKLNEGKEKAHSKEEKAHLKEGRPIETKSETQIETKP